METITIYSLSIAVLSIILGFIALLTQKVYIDRETNQITEIEIPVMGKMKTNIPALVFLFIGAGLAVITLYKCYPPKMADWVIEGSFIKPVGDTNKIDFHKGMLTIIPNDVNIAFSDKGTFTIKTKISEGKDLEDVIQCIMFSHPDANAQILLKPEYEKYLKEQNSLVESLTKNYRKYKPQTINIVPGN